MRERERGREKSGASACMCGSACPPWLQQARSGQSGGLTFATWAFLAHAAADATAEGKMNAPPIHHLEDGPALTHSVHSTRKPARMPGHPLKTAAAAAAQARPGSAATHLPPDPRRCRPKIPDGHSREARHCEEDGFSSFSTSLARVKLSKEMDGEPNHGAPFDGSSALFHGG